MSKGIFLNCLNHLEKSIDDVIISPLNSLNLIFEKACSDLSPCIFLNLNPHFAVPSNDHSSKKAQIYCSMTEIL